jgi:hypothetical protein
MHTRADGLTHLMAKADQISTPSRELHARGFGRRGSLGSIGGDRRSGRSLRRVNGQPKPSGFTETRLHGWGGRTRTCECHSEKCPLKCRMNSP